MFIHCCDGPVRHIRFTKNESFQKDEWWWKEFDNENEAKEYATQKGFHWKVFNLDLVESEYCPYYSLPFRERIQHCKKDSCGKRKVDTYDGSILGDSGCQFAEEIMNWLYWNGGPGTQGIMGPGEGK
jgi:hypothetical protein